jgi:hypothetical protein
MKNWIFNQNAFFSFRLSIILSSKTNLRTIQISQQPNNNMIEYLQKNKLGLQDFFYFKSKFLKIS